MNHDLLAERNTDLYSPERNNFYYGKLMTEYNFKQETHYFMHLRRLHNRLVSGYGVVTGLDVVQTQNERGVIITRGYAVDKWGRDIIVPSDTPAIPIEDDVIVQAKDEAQKWDEEDGTQRGKQEHRYDDAVWTHVVLCYHECPTDPAPVMAGDCPAPGACESGTILERFKVEFRPGRTDYDTYLELPDPDVIVNGRLNYEDLVELVTRGSLSDYLDLPDDPCIPLANVLVALPEDSDPMRVLEIDITIRPIVYTNDLLFDIFLSLLLDMPRTRRGK